MRKFLSGVFISLLAVGMLRGDQIDFRLGTQTPGGLPAGFSSALAGFGHPGQWGITNDLVPPALAGTTGATAAAMRQGVLAQTAVEPLDEHFPMCVYDGANFRDFKFTTRFKTVSGLMEQMAGIVFRYQNASNFYVLRMSALGHNLSFYPMVNGVRPYDPIPIAVGLNFEDGSWHSLGVSCEGINFTCWLDGKAVGPQIHDPTFAIGKVGFWTKSDAVSYFTDASVDYTPLVPGAQRLIDHIMAEQPRIVGLRIYTLDTNGVPHVLASKVASEVGTVGEAAEKVAITDGTEYFGTTKDTVVIIEAFRDRNGDPIGAVRFEFNSYFGETQDAAVTRATALLRKMEEEITSSDELVQ